MISYFIIKKMKAIVFVIFVIAGRAFQITQSTFPTGPVNLKSDIGTYLGRCLLCGPGAYYESAAVHQTNPAHSSTIWTVQRFGDKVALKADIGKYLGRCNNCWVLGSYGGQDSAFVHVPHSDPLSYDALWIPEDLGNGKWALKGDNQKYLARCNNCVVGGFIPDFAFINIDSAQDNPLAQWTVTRL